MTKLRYVHDDGSTSYYDEGTNYWYDHEDPRQSNVSYPAVWIVELFDYGAQNPADCLPDFYETKNQAEAAGKEALTTYDWAERFSLRCEPYES